MQPSKEVKEKTSPQDKHKTAVWRGSPRVWERCAFCEIKKKCDSAGVKRGSTACIDARYALVKGN